MNWHNLRKQFENELVDNVLNYWVDNVYDATRGTFFGRITNQGERFAEAPLSAVFVTRIMWTFSAAYHFYSTAAYKKMADEAFRILQTSFWDNQNGGIYWNIFPDGKPVDTKKQFYAQAFFIYALSEYYLAFHDEKAKQLAISVFMLMEKFACDSDFGGYFEVTTADWKSADDQYLSPQNLDVKKSMNTHLHILEAYTNLYRIWKTEDSEKKLRQLIQIFSDKIINEETWHFRLFFDADWTVRSEIDSYGHDIEGSWLLCEAAEVLGDPKVIEEVEQIAVKMAGVTRDEGFAEHGGMYYEKEADRLMEQFDWWPQAESVVGFFNAWQLTKKEEYLECSKRSWQFIQKCIIDKKNGEWFWGVSKDLHPLTTDKVNGWKAPYHNGRMCLEMMRRIDTLIR
ncbi:mannobiose 2-epimerase [Mariniphaga anaerophila]|uniref:Cellobiose 2-epimerase n=1 Tax=Mariniphaga anaerophila TaxID=1484053 RepID=A0A1M4WGE4_9BACT|nr:AGE family epimerase/isomerase [Mariniphaga anaerophila]SHE80284.1 mannobiose 2-epimerase [Mariniphaga anaerophila]